MEVSAKEIENYCEENNQNVSLEGFLVWCVHRILLSKWKLVDSSSPKILESFHQVDYQLVLFDSTSSSSFPTVTYMNSHENQVQVRAIHIGSKLFIHFVLDQFSCRLDLQPKEYVRKLSEHPLWQQTGCHVVAVQEWICNVESLVGRIERGVFHRIEEHEVGQVYAQSEAELIGLSETILLYLGKFLNAHDLTNMSLSNKRLKQLVGNEENLWKSLLLQDFRCVYIADGETAKDVYIKLFKERKRRVWERTSRREMEQYAWLVVEQWWRGLDSPHRRGLQGGGFYPYPMFRIGPGRNDDDDDQLHLFPNSEPLNSRHHPPFPPF